MTPQNDQTVCCGLCSVRKGCKLSPSCLHHQDIFTKDTANNQPDGLREILNYCRVHYGSNGISDEYEEELISRIKDYAKKAELEGELREARKAEAILQMHNMDTVAEVREVFEGRVKQLQAQTEEEE